MHMLSPSSLKQPKMIQRFQPFSQAEMRGELMREFGNAYEVTGTGNYLIVHPIGKRDLWAQRFEELYRSMTHFFRTRGFPMQQPKFPFVGIVFYSKKQYMQYTRARFDGNASGSYGYYMPQTNRIYLYDATRGAGAKSSEWPENLGTVMHEAAHQTAFNTGIHIRSAATPRWLVEGLGCLFEAPGIYNSFHFRNQQDRINYGRLEDFQGYVKSIAPDVIASIVASDKPFQFDGGRSYAAAWALTFYLSEREPRNYIRYLRTVAKHKSLEPYDAAERVREFATIFGKDYRMVAARVTRFIDQLPQAKGSSTR